MNSVAHKIIQVVEMLKQENDLRPTDRINTLFGCLVRAALEPQTETILNRLQLREIHDVCAQGEACLEHYWVERVLQAHDPLTELSAFPYLSNYQALAQAELSLIRQHTPHVKRILFVGSGPLPLSALLFEKEGWFEAIDGLDADNLAVQMSNRLCTALGSGLQCIHNRAEHFARYQEYDLIFLAALVGMTDADKQNLLRIIRTSLPGESYVAIRSVTGSRELIYPKLSRLPQGYNEVGRFVPDDEVINTLILSRII
jgi:nicotianamine synthase